MELEVVDAYVVNCERNPKGTLHVFFQLGGIGIDLRGIFWMKRNNKYLFRLPDRYAIDSEGEKVRYPVFSFVDRAQSNKMMNEIRRLAPAIIDEKLAETPATPSKEKSVCRVGE